MTSGYRLCDICTGDDYYLVFNLTLGFWLYVKHQQIRHQHRVLPKMDMFRIWAPSTGADIMLFL